MSTILNFVRLMFYTVNSLLLPFLNPSRKNHRERIFEGVEVDGEISDLLSLFIKSLNPEFGLIR